MSDERTTKIVTALVELRFHGDYIDKDSITGYVDGWISSGLEDRDDLKGWMIIFSPVREVGVDLPLMED